MPGHIDTKLDWKEWKNNDLTARDTWTKTPGGSGLSNIFSDPPPPPPGLKRAQWNRDEIPKRTNQNRANPCRLEEPTR